MAKIDTEKLVANLRERLPDEGALKLKGMNVEDLADAVSHPKAAAIIQGMFDLDASAVQQGDVAPPIDLPWLGAPPAGRPEHFSLAEFRDQRPVALIFGSYT